MLHSLRRYIGRQGAVIALLLFTVHLLPQELVHQFFSHNDTEDCAVSNDSPVTLSSLHIHCDFEQTEGTALEPISFQFSPIITAHVFAHPIYVFAPVVAEQPSCLFLRGPPVC